MPINVYTQQVIQQRQTPRLDNPAAVQLAGGVARAGADVAGFGAEYLEKKQLTEDKIKLNDGLINYQKDLFNLEKDLQQQNLSTPEGYSKKFEVASAELLSQYKQGYSGETQSIFEQSAKSYNLRGYQSGVTWQNQREIEKFDNTLKKNKLDLGELAYAQGAAGQELSPDFFNNADATTVAGGDLYAADQLALFNEDMREHIAKSYVQGMNETNPVGAYKELGAIEKVATGDVDFDVAMDVVEKNEGGYVAIDGASGAPAIYGINRKWWEDEFDEAKRITEEQGEKAGKEYARSFYKKNFYDKFGIDKLSGAQKIVVFDGAVNHRESFVKELVSAAEDGASASELIAMRKNEYMRLGQSEKHAGSLQGWMSRMAKVEGVVKTGEVLSVESITQLKREARDLTIKQKERIEFDNLAGSIAVNQGNLERLANGELTLKDLDAIEESQGENPFTVMARKELLKPKVKRSESDKAQVYMDLLEEKNTIMLNLEEDVKVTPNTLAEYKSYQDKVMQAVEQDYVTAAKGASLLGKYSGFITEAIDAGRSGGDESTFKRGVQDPYDKAFKVIKEKFKGDKSPNVALKKRELFDLFDAYLGDYQSSGSIEQDRNTINEAMKKANKAYAENIVPELTLVDGTPNAVIKGGEVIGVSDESSAKPQGKISVPFTVMEDAQGNRARVYPDGRIEEIK